MLCITEKIVKIVFSGSRCRDWEMGEARILTHISRIDARGVGVKFQATLVTDDTNGQIRGRELRREVRGKGREEVLFEIRCGGRG